MQKKKYQMTSCN